MSYGTFERERLEKMECPFCGKGVIVIRHIFPIKNQNLSSSVAGKKAKSTHKSKEREDVENDCPSCKAKRKDIQKKLNQGSISKPPSREEILKRLKDAGLATKI